MILALNNDIVSIATQCITHKIMHQLIDSFFRCTEEVYSPPTMWQAALRKEMEKTKQLEEKYVNKLKFHNVSGIVI